MSLDKDTIEKRIAILDEDIVKIKQNLQNLEQQKIETVGMINALNGARQQCQSFLNKVSDDEPDASDSSDVE